MGDEANALYMTISKFATRKKSKRLPIKPWPKPRLRILTYQT